MGKLTQAQRSVLEVAAERLWIGPRFRQERMFERMENAGWLSGHRHGGFITYQITDAGRQALTGEPG